MKVAMFQMENAGSIEKNLDKSIKAIEAAAERGADVILFPEVHLTEFFPQYEGRDVSGYRITIDSHAVEMFRSACRKYRIIAVPNVYLEENGKAYDASLVIGRDGEIIGIQKMVHVAQAEYFYEQDYYEPADDGFKVFDTDAGRIGITVCFDRHYPESMRTETLMGADVILIPTVNTKAEPMDMFEKEICSQCFQNCVAACMCNRVGSEDDMEFAGESVAVSAEGRIITKAGDEEELVFADINIEEVRRIECVKYSV